MYLKRLELQGFKSFQARTVFDFAPGITAVVGPNGSGKSNVAESLRWVLGEQSARNVRARRLEDVIFSGSSQKAAVGMAEVSITLDNAEGWLPVDYSEVVVSRRAYRSGESEYLINKQRVRLRDVVDLFLRARVGQNSYAFMGQGLVEEVLVMRPEERRRLLEEAADVRLLRTRLDEARDRLSATRENLERVQLLLDEIGPRLQQLERQASRAGEHSRLARELADTLRQLYAQLWRDGNEALLAARASLDQKQQELAVSRDAAKACEEGLTALTGALEERERELGVRRQRQRALTDRIHTSEQRLSLDQERTAAQTARRGELRAELESLQAERVDLQTAAAASTQRRLAIQPEIEEAAQLVQTRRNELTALEQEQGALRRRVAEAEEQIERSRRAAGEASAALTRLAEDEARLQGESQRRTTRRRDLMQKLAESGREFKALRERLTDIEAEVASADSERADAYTDVEQGRTAVAGLESETLRAEGRVAQLTARLEMLQQLQGASDGLEAGVRYLLGGEAEGSTDRRHQEAVEGLIGLVRDLIRVPQGLELAIEAALAENVQALAFENLASALVAIDLLQERKGGRALIYPLDIVRASSPVNLMRERGIYGVAARMVRCENRYRGLVDAILGRTIIVDNLPLAQQVLRRGLGNVVTLEGVLLRPGGGVSGGVSKAATETFSRQRELEEVPEELRQAELQHQNAAERLEREKTSLRESEGRLALAEPRLQAAREERAQLQTARLDNRGRLIVLRGEARALWADINRDDDRTDWRGRRTRFAQDRDRLESESEAGEAALVGDREALSAFTARRNAAIDAITEAASAHAGLEGEARSLARQLEQEQASLLRAEQRLHSREETLTAIEADLVGVRERDEATATDLAQAREEFQALAAEMEPAEGELAHLLNRERSMREQLSQARTRLLQAERAHIEAEAAVKLRGDEIDGLREVMAGEGLRPQGDDVVPADTPAELDSQPGRLPPIRGGAEVAVETLRRDVARLRNQIRGLGPVNEQAATDYGENKERYDFLHAQVADLKGSEETLLAAIDELEGNIRERLKETFAQVDRDFQRYFEAFFEGGKSHLSLTLPDDTANSGIEIVAQPPGKRVNTLVSLSGGERALTALALLLALLDANPSPICVLDEVDAALDETNVGRFVEALRALEKKTQFVIITHNPRTVEAADSIYGISMGSDNTSRVLSLRLDDIKK